MIVEVNLAQDWYSSSPPQLNRYAPERASGTPAADCAHTVPGTASPDATQHRA